MYMAFVGSKSVGLSFRKCLMSIPFFGLMAISAMADHFYHSRKGSADVHCQNEALHSGYL